MIIKTIYKIYSQHFLVDTDTRKIRKDTIFFALNGDNFNGNKYAEEALKLGASYAIVDEKEYQTHPNIIFVDNVLDTLQKLANYHRKQLKIPIIALTGSNGKTTTKELIHSVLSKKFRSTATKGNLNNHIGVPLTLLSMTPETEIGIVEMGANHQKEIEFLCTICEPDFGYITNFGKAHLEGFGGIEGVVKGKSELYSYLKNNKKIAFINPEDSIQVEKTNHLETIPFLKEVQFLEVNPFVQIQFYSKKIQSHLIGSYNFTNMAIAITMGTYFKINNEDIKNAIESYVPTNNRSQIIQKQHNRIILDAYNANPSSMKVALENFAMLEEASKTVILGDMFELGKDSLFEHQSIVNLVSALNFENVFFVGENFYQTTSEEHQFKTFDNLNSYLLINPLSEQFIFIKGSRGMKLERILEVIK